MDKKEIEINGKKLFYRCGGQGDTVLFVHGFGEDGNVWRNQLSFLEEKFRLLVPDLPGTGQSELAADPSMGGLATILNQLLDAEKVERCVMIGHSMGGYITLAFADLFPARLNGFGLFHSSAYADTEDKKTARRKGIEFVREHGAFEFFKGSVPNLFSPDTKAHHPEMIEAQINSLGNSFPDATVSYYEEMIKRSDKTMVLRTSTIPVLFVAGKSDTAIPLDDVLKQCHLPSLSYIHLLNNSGHMGMLEEPAASNQILEQFLRYISAI